METSSPYGENSANVKIGAFIGTVFMSPLHRRLRDLAPGLTPRAVLKKFSAMQMIDVHLPTSGGSTIILSRYIQPDTDLQLLLKQLKPELPDQSPKSLPQADWPNYPATILP